MRRNLTPAALARELALPKCGTLATYRKDGSVLLSPVWQEWSDGGFSVHLGQGGLNHRLLQRDPRVSLVMYGDDPPYWGVEVKGTARFTKEDERGLLRRLAVRYLGNQQGNVYADKANWEGIVLRIEPGDIRLWDFADEYPIQ